MEKVQFYGTGRRKSSVARVRLVAGEGNITVNGRALDEYFDYDTLIRDVKQPLVLTNNENKYDVIVKVEGGGFTGQAGAIRHGISRALLKADEELRGALKKEGFLTRDARMKERKKQIRIKGCKKSTSILKKIVLPYMVFSKVLKLLTSRLFLLYKNIYIRKDFLEELILIHRDYSFDIIKVKRVIIKGDNVWMKLHLIGVTFMGSLQQHY